MTLFVYNYVHIYHFVDTEGKFKCCLFVLCFKCFQLPIFPCAYLRTAKGNLRIFFKSAKINEYF